MFELLLATDVGNV